MKHTARGWLLVAGLAVLALLFAFLLSIFYPDASSGFIPRPINTPPLPPTGFGRRREGFDEQLTGFWRYLAQMFTLLGSGLIALFFLPRPLGQAAGLLRAGVPVLLRAIVAGIVGVALLAVLSVLASNSTLGPVVSVLAISLLVPTAIICASAAALAIGRTLAAILLRDSAPSPFTDLLSGLLFIFILLIIPVIGFWLLVIVAAIGLGSLLLVRQSDNRTALDEMEY